MLLVTLRVLAWVIPTLELSRLGRESGPHPLEVHGILRIDSPKLLLLLLLTVICLLGNVLLLMPYLLPGS
jgi:hypothetical protein